MAAPITMTKKIMTKTATKAGGQTTTITKTTTVTITITTGAAQSAQRRKVKT